MDEPNYNYDKRRFETFIDAVIAIILTILVLELKIPESEHSADISTKEQVKVLLPFFISYIGSYLLIVGIWIDNHILFLNLQRLTKRYILLNMLFILSLSLVPFTTAFAGKNYHDSFAVALLFTNYFIMNLTFGLLYWYAKWKEIISLKFMEENKATGRFAIFGIVGLIASIPLAYIHTYISFALGIIIFAGHLAKKK